MNKKICCFLIMAILLVPTATVIASANAEVTDNIATDDATANPEGVATKDVTNNRAIGNVHIDESEVLKQLGFTQEEMSNISSKLKIQILRSYNPVLELGEDGDYYGTINSSTPKAAINLIGTDKIAPDLSISSIPTPQVTDSSQKSGVAPDYIYDARACLVFAIWDYYGASHDLPDVEDEYNAITNDITYTYAYEYWNFMTNDYCTYDHIRLWITWACAAYSNVDVYWDGHGCLVNDETAFVSYNVFYSGGTNTSAYYFANDFDTATYDYSSLRVGMGSFCYGYNFHETFTDPGGSVNHNRFFVGPDSIVTIEYTGVYMSTWGDNWYNDYYSTVYSHEAARDAAYSNIGSGSQFSCDDIYTSIWFR